jgi:hypothetical protein
VIVRLALSTSTFGAIPAGLVEGVVDCLLDHDLGLLLDGVADLLDQFRRRHESERRETAKVLRANGADIDGHPACEVWSSGRGLRGRPGFRLPVMGRCDSCGPLAIWRSR